MDVRLLRAFLAVLRHGSYTRAAQELHLSQSAVWRQVRQLEQELGVRLFDQIGKTLHTTDAGLALAGEAEKLLAHVASVEATLRSLGGGLHGRLRIGASTTPGYWLLPPILGRFAARHRDLDLRYRIDNSATIQHLILQNEIDFGFVGGPIHRPDLLVEEWESDEIVCFTSPAHPLAKREQLTMRDLIEEPCVLREPGSSTRRMFEGWLQSQDLSLGRSLEIRCPEALKLLVAAGFGFSILSSHGISAEVSRGDLVQLQVDGFSLVRVLQILRHPDQRSTAPARAFLETCRAEITGTREPGAS